MIYSGFTHILFHFSIFSDVDLSYPHLIIIIIYHYYSVDKLCNLKIYIKYSLNNLIFSHIATVDFFLK